MTYLDIMVQILTEVTGEPPEKLRKALLMTKEAAEEGGKTTRFDQEIPDEKAQDMLVKFRAEGPGILAWYVRCCVQAHQDLEKAAQFPGSKTPDPGDPGKWS